MLSLLVGLVASLLLHLTSPAVRLQDLDAFHYVMGARSLRAGHGYTDALGTPIRAWPPAYSFWLSLFPDPIAAAHWTNVIAFGLAAALLFRLLRSATWPGALALSAVTALWAGWFRLLAVPAKPDVLNYALFLFGVCLFRRGEKGKLVAFGIWSGSIWLKWVSLVFTPAFVLVDIAEERRVPRARAAFATATWALAFLPLLRRNLATYHQVYVTRLTPSLGRVVRNLGELALALHRNFFAAWYGSARSGWGLVGLLATLAFAYRALGTLRPNPEGRRFRIMALALAFWLLVLVSSNNFGRETRLFGYPFLCLLPALLPNPRATKAWATYALIALVVGLGNDALVPSLGGNDPRYDRWVEALRPLPLGVGPLCTNSYHLVDLRRGVGTKPVERLEDVPPGGFLLKVSWPNYDPMVNLAWPIAEPGPRWRVLGRTEGATLYQRPGVDHLSEQADRQTGDSERIRDSSSEERRATSALQPMRSRGLAKHSLAFSS